MQILLGITGGIAAYKGPELVRALRRRGHAVRCVVTPAGARMVARDALAAVSGHPVAEDLFTGGGTIPHIDLARWAEALVIAPATADLLARLRFGLADDLLTTLVLALEPGKPVWLAPAMNTVMWEKPVVQENLSVLMARGLRQIPPVSGNLACGESGMGAMADPEAIADIIGGGPAEAGG